MEVVALAFEKSLQNIFDNYFWKVVAFKLALFPKQSSTTLNSSIFILILGASFFVELPIFKPHN